MTVPAVVFFVEAAADVQTAETLLARVVDEGAPDWWCELPREAKYQVVAPDVATAPEHTVPYVKWASLPELLRKTAPGFRGTQGFGGGAYRAQARKALALATLHPTLQEAAALVLVVDADTDPRRAQQLRDGAAGTSGPQTQALACGAAIRKREAWHLNGFAPRSDGETRRYQAAKQSLTLDPVHEAHRLNGDSSDPQTNDRCAKRVLDALVQGDRDREHACIAETDLATLRQRGSQTGLTDFLSELSGVAARLRGGP